MTALILVLLKFLEYYDVQSIKGYPTESFSHVEILEKQWRFEFSKLSQKVAWLPWQHTLGLIGETELFLMENTKKEN